MVRQSQKILLTGLLSSLLLSLLVSMFVASSYRASNQNPSLVTSYSELQKELNECLNGTITQIKPDKITIDSYEQIWRICGNQMYNQMLLNDFTIRREKFLQQELDERVNLWMVVAITISGVILSGAQLMMSYKLASAGKTEFAKDSVLIAEQGKISFRSSVTGVAILSLSLIFFIVYVKWIYTAQDILTEKPASLQTPLPKLVKGGALGFPKSVQPENNQKDISPETKP